MAQSNQNAGPAQGKANDETAKANNTPQVEQSKQNLGSVQKKGTLSKFVATVANIYNGVYYREGSILEAEKLPSKHFELMK